METVAAKVPSNLVQQMDSFIRHGDYSNRSEVMRVALRKFIADAARIPGDRKRAVFEARVQRHKDLMARIGSDSRYRGRWVAVHENKVLDSDDYMDPLVQRVLLRREQPIQIGLANPEGRLPSVRGPGVRVKVQR